MQDHHRRAGRASSLVDFGGFVVTAGIVEVAIAERFERSNDDSHRESYISAWPRSSATRSVTTPAA
jgi:hypothetical protein